MPYPQTTAYTAIALAYKNKSYIASSVMPTVNVNEKRYAYLNYNLKDFFTQADTKMGKSAEVNLIEHAAELSYGACVDHGLGEIVASEDIENAKKRKQDALKNSVEIISEKMALARELRVANIAKDVHNYNHSIELEADMQATINDESFDFAGLIRTAIDQPLATPNKLVVGSHIWQKIISNKSLLKTLYHNNRDGLGIVKEKDFCDFFGLDEVIIAKAKHNTANAGQDIALGNIWGDFMAFHYTPPSFNNLKHDLAWGMTAEYERPKVQQFKKPESGTQGSVKIQVTHIYNKQILCKDAGVLILPKQTTGV